MSETYPVFTDDAYLTNCESKVVCTTDRGGIILDRTVFYATSGGQPGDSGHLIQSDGSTIEIATTVHGESKKEIVLVPAEGEKMPSEGETVQCKIDWQRRYRLMQMHTACHLLSVVCPYPITSAGVGEKDSRIDFDLPESIVAKDEVTERLMELVNQDHPVFTQWITEEELEANPAIVRSKNVKPPRGVGRIRLVCIGENSSVDSQPCGGTHVKSTGEIGAIHIGKIEKKGKENRRFRIRFGDLPVN